MKLIENSPYKILSIIGGQHSCGLAYFENGEVKVVLEEERLTRVKPYVDLHDNFFRYPLSSINELINKYGVDINSIDYFVSFLDYNVVKNHPTLFAPIKDFANDFIAQGSQFLKAQNKDKVHGLKAKGTLHGPEYHDDHMRLGDLAIQGLLYASGPYQH